MPRHTRAASPSNTRKSANGMDRRCSPYPARSGVTGAQVSSRLQIPAIISAADRASAARFSKAILQSASKRNARCLPSSVFDTLNGERSRARLGWPFSAELVGDGKQGPPIVGGTVVCDLGRDTGIVPAELFKIVSGPACGFTPEVFDALRLAAEGYDLFTQMPL